MRNNRMTFLMICILFWFFFAVYLSPLINPSLFLLCSNYQIYKFKRICPQIYSGFDVNVPGVTRRLRHRKLKTPEWKI